VRALVVGGAPVDGVTDVVRALASSHDIVIAADAGATACLASGRIPDLVVGDFDSLDEGRAAELAALGVPMQCVPAEKDVTDLDLAIDAARERGAASLTLTGVLGARFDHSLAALGSLMRAADLCPAVAEPGLEGWLLSLEGRASLDVTRRQGKTMSLLALSDAVVTSSGVRYPLIARQLPALSSLGISNIVQDDIAHVALQSGVLLVLVILEHDA